MNIEKELPASANWSAFWSAGAINSCAGSFDGNYGGAIALWWREIIKQMSPINNMLDLCTGNGAVPHLVQSQIDDDEKLPQILGVDRASIAPAWLSTLSAQRAEKIKLMGCVNADRLPVGDGAIDFITSQFGFEYCDPDKTLQELARISHENSLLLFVMHHEESIISRVSSEEMSHCHFLLQAGGLVESAKQFFPLMAQIKNAEDMPRIFSNPVARKVHSEYVTALEMTSARASQASVPDILHETLGHVATIGRSVQSAGIEKAMGMLEKLERSLNESVVRFVDQVNRAYSKSDIEQLLKKMEHFNFFGSVTEISEPGHGVLAWGLRAERNRK